MMVRIGQGYDLHRLEDGLPLIIGGVRIDSAKGSVAHSDGDVLLHALADALYGAVADGDIGYHFPPSNPDYRNLNSAVILKHAVNLTREKGFSISNIDCTVVLQKPILRPYMNDIIGKIAELCSIPSEAVSVKAKTKEGVDSTGKGEAIEAFSSVLIYRS
ncbi:2-C-methyl-D-erythritol 2,4-cyclodiphosphate synthase [Spirochaetia bacterium 38H-sp]|uniref:2-C-methyl-D-erythritol 2,4-cyclodiphosphate synthase n=1 Tax=Rarispira pelagica TaxID=3141764 RepID=A0ABU9U8Q8_9SPIR